MAQEVQEEMNKVLRERGIIGDNFAKAEQATKVKREQLALGMAGAIAVLFLLKILGARSCNMIMLVWPLLGTIRAVEYNNTEALKKWSCYWIVYAFVQLFLEFIFHSLYGSIRRIYFVKLCMLAFCAAPMKNNGSIMLFDKVFKGKLFPGGGMGGGGGAAAGPRRESSPMRGGRSRF